MHLLKYFDKLSLKPVNAKELKGLILDLAIRGRLTKEWRNTNNEKISLKKLANLTQNEIKDLENEYSEIELNIPTSWYKSYFKRLLDIKGGSQPPKSNFISENRQGYVRLYQIRDFGTKPVPVYVPKDLVTKFCTEKDVMIGRYGASIGKVFMGKNGAYNVALVKLIFDREVFDTTFIYYFFKTSSMQDFFGNSNRSAQAGFNKTDLGVLEMPIPPLEEQKVIVKIVNQLMTEVDQLQRQAKTRVELRHDFIKSSLRQLTTANSLSEWKKLQPQFTSFFNTVESIDRLKEAILQLAVQGKLTKQWREDNPDVESASVLLERIKEEKAKLIKEKKIKKEKPLPEITAEEIPFELPEGWVWCRIGEASSVRVGATPKRNEPVYWNGNVSWVSSGEVANNFIYDTKEKITNKALKESSVTIYPKGTVLVAMIGQGKTRGQTSILKIEAGTNQNVAGIMLFQGKIISEYLWYYFLGRYKKTRSNASGGNQPAINGSKIKMSVLGLPSISEQQAIVKIINQLMYYIKQLKSEIENRNTLAKDFLRSSIKEVMEKTQS